jgi:hypothetical protein
LGGLALSRDLAHHIPGAQLVVVKQPAHDLLTESAQATAASMISFLSNLGKRSLHHDRPKDLEPSGLTPSEKAKSHFGNAE